jgi:DNA polymerase-3 subunit alpha
MAANLTNEINNPNTFAWYMEEAQALGIPIDPPNVNNSDKNFTVSEGRIVFGLVGIKNVGSAAVEEIIRARRAEGPYSSFAEFLERVDLKTVNRKVVETLIQAGAFDSLEPNRNVLFTNVGTYIDIAAKNREARRYGQTSLFDGEDDSYKALQIENVEDWPYAERLAHEKELLGYYVSGHPLDPYREKWQKCVSVNLANTAGVSLERSYQLVGILKGVRLIYTKNGKPMAFATLEDFNGSIEIVFFEEPCTTYRDSLIDDTVVGLVGSLDMRNEKLQFVVEEVRDIAELEERDAAEVHIRLTPDGNGAEELYQLRAFLFERSGTSPVYLHIGCNGNAEYGAHNGKEAVGGGGADQGDAHEAPAAGAGNCAAAGNGYAAGETVIRASSQLCISSKDAVLEEIRRYPRVQAVWKT